jgi:arylsulfate sulfotransferase
LGQHAPEILPNGNLLVFDNGASRNTDNELNYSRAVEYQINEDQKTVTQVWQYGKERGNKFYSLIISDVDYLPQTKNILVTSGYIMPEADYSAKIVEVDYQTRQEVFEATLYYKTLNGNKTGAWGQSDILYRSERMDLKY